MIGEGLNLPDPAQLNHGGRALLHGGNAAGQTDGVLSLTRAGGVVVQGLPVEKYNSLRAEGPDRLPHDAGVSGANPDAVGYSGERPVRSAKLNPERRDDPPDS